MKYPNKVCYLYVCLRLGLVLPGICFLVMTHLHKAEVSSSNEGT